MERPNTQRTKGKQARPKFTSVLRRTPEQVQRRAERSTGGYDRLLEDGIKTFSPKEGSNVVRILPATWEGADHYGYDVAVHYGVGPDNGRYVCAWTFDRQKCPLCEERNEILNRKDRSTEDEEYAQELKPTKRVACWVLNRKEPDAGPLLWLTPAGVDTDLAEISQEEMGGGVLMIDDLDEGYDVEFHREGSGLRTKYTALRVARRSSPACADDAEQEEVVAYITKHPVPAVFKEYGYAHILSIFKGQPVSAADIPSEDEAVDVGTMAQDEDGEDEVSDVLEEEDGETEPEPQPAVRGRSELRSRLAGMNRK